MKVEMMVAMPGLGLGLAGDGASPTTYNFDQGSYASFAEVSAGFYRITPILHWNGKWAWWCLRSGRFAGQTPHFLIAKANHFNLVSGEWLACWAADADTDTWYQFDNVSIGASDIEIYHNTAFPAGVIYMAALPMYPYSRVQRRVATLAANALVGDTISTTNLIIANMTARDANDGTGRTSPALPIYGMKFANATANTKNRAVLSSLQHPSETPGAFALEGALDWLITTSPAQKFLLDWFEFFVYPCRNPQGVYSGYFRVQPQNKVSGALWTTDGQWETVDLMKPAIIADIGGTSVDVMLDFHSEMAAADIDGIVVNGDTTGLYPIFAAAMETLDTDFELTQAAVGAEDGTLGKLLRDTYGVDLYTTLEQGGEVARGIADWKTFGANALKALATMVAQGNFPQGPGVGARSFNGTTDRLERASAANLKDHALTISLQIYIDAIPANGYMFAIHQAGDAAVAMYFNVSRTTGDFVSFGVLGTSNMQRASVAGNPTTGAWISYIVTWDGVITAATGVHIYKNNVETTPYDTTTNGATSATATGKWSIGGRVYDDARNVDAKEAQVRVFNRVLTSDERAQEAAGILTTTSGLVSWLKGNTASLTDAVDAATWTADGTTQLTGVGTGPAIIYP